MCFCFAKLMSGVMPVNYRRKQCDEIFTKRNQAGFSLVELIMVCVILIIVSAIAVPNIMQANANYKLDAAGHSVASLLQQTRMQAVKLNQPQYAQFDPATKMAFANDGTTATYATGNPDIALGSGLSFQIPIDAWRAQFDTYVGGAPPADHINQPIGFNSRGLPCSLGANPLVCPAATTGYEWFIQGPRGWEAITITPAGRIKSWRLSSSSTSTATWQ
jgi:type II secretory pathway pseudopilin PulG